MIFAHPKKPAFVFVAALLLTAFAHSQGPTKTRYAIFLAGARIGRGEMTQSPDAFGGKPALRSDSSTSIDADLMGQSLHMKVVASSWSISGVLKRSKTISESGGRRQLVDATFGPAYAEIEVDNSGAKSHKRLAIPQGKPIVDDPMVDVLSRKGLGQSFEYYVFDATTISFKKTKIVLKGDSYAEIFGQKIKAKLIELVDPQATVEVYVDKAGSMVKAEGPFNTEFIPEELVKVGQAPPASSIDLASASSIPTDVPIDNANVARRVLLQVQGKELELVTDDHETVTKDPSGGYRIDIRPALVSKEPAAPIALLSKEKPEWTKPSSYLPSDSPTFISLAAKLAKGKSGKDAALSIRRYVHGIMQPNAGIGVVRDAREVLKTKEGVCRDYAVLTTTLLRAAGIPARLATGLEYANGRYYYHAWSEAWLGAHWIGIDSTVDEDQISAGHLKLASGQLDQAFTFPVLDHVVFHVLAQDSGEKR